MHKKPIVFAIILSLALLAFAATAVAEHGDTPDYKATFKLGEASYVVNDVTSTMDVAAFVENGRTYVPFRYLGYALGVIEENVTWDAASKTSTLTLGDITEEFTIGSTQFSVNGEFKYMDVAPLIRNSRIFLPARYVAQDFGYLVDWDAQAKVVTVTRDAPKQQTDENPSVPDDVYSPATLDKTVLYIPLDNRPVNYKNALGLANLADFNLAYPSQGQLTTNTNLNNWLAKQTPHNRAAVVSLDMLLYGGLVESRKHNLEMNELSNRVNTVMNIKNNNNPVYAFISVMRAPMANTPHTMPDYYAKYGAQIFKYGELLDKTRLGVIEPSEVNKLNELTRTIPWEYLKDFTDRRDKNYHAIEQILKLVQQGYIDRLLISKDDTAPHGFTRMEAERLAALVQRYNIAGKVQFLTGTDECGQVLLAAMANRLSVGVGNKAPRVFVDYAFPSLAGNIPLYEDVPLQQNVKLHIKATDATLAQVPEEADLVLAVHNGPGPSETQSITVDEVTKAKQHFIERIKNYTAQGIPVTIADVNYPNMADAGFMETLNKHYDLSQLAGYSGWNTAGNSVGLALSQGIITTGHTGSDYPAFTKNQQAIILKCLLEDWGYQAVVRPVIKKKVPAEQQTLMTDQNLEQQTTVEIEKMLNDFANRNLQEDFDNVGLYQVNLPWHRLFDIDFEI